MLKIITLANTVFANQVNKIKKYKKKKLEREDTPTSEKVLVNVFEPQAQKADYNWITFGWTSSLSFPSYRISANFNNFS